MFLPQSERPSFVQKIKELVIYYDDTTKSCVCLKFYVGESEIYHTEMQISVSSDFRGVKDLSSSVKFIHTFHDTQHRAE